MRHRSGLLLVLSLVVVALVSFAALFLFLLVVGGRYAARHFQVGEAVTHRWPRRTRLREADDDFTGSGSGSAQSASTRMSGGA